MTNRKTNYLQEISLHYKEHARGTSWFTEHEALNQVLFSEMHHCNKSVMNFFVVGEITFPFFSMGTIDTNKLFGINEIILFFFYFINRKKYKKVLDLGANVGLHTLIMKKLGFEVISYEPDEIQQNQFKKVMDLNGFDTSFLKAKAVSDKSGRMKYLRILDNTTGSHLLGSKEDVYGPTDIVSVEVDDILEVVIEGDFNFIKMDVEGHEAVLLNRITTESLNHTDVMLEIGSKNNSNAIFDIFKKKGIPAYAQKINWERVKNLEDLPSHHTHGSVFLSMRGAPKWS